MTFAVPVEPVDIAAELRQLEATAPKPTSGAIKHALLRGAQEIEVWRKLAEDCAKELEEADRMRISQMDSASRVDEVHRRIKQALTGCAARLRARL